MQKSQVEKQVNERRVSKQHILIGVIIAYCSVFVFTHGHTVRNRFTDAWWHIAAADEYIRTGRFAEDPFLKDVPQFAQFGLMDVATATVSRVTNRKIKISRQLSQRKLYHTTERKYE